MLRYFDQERVLELREEFEKLNPREILTRAKEEFGDKLMMTSSFGPGGIVLMSILKDIVPDIPIYFIDTRFHFKETLDLVEKIKELWDLNIITISTKYSEGELEEIIGKDSYKNNIDECCQYRKVKPLLKIINPDSVWITSVRRDQAQLPSRRHVIVFDGRGTLKVNPLCFWTKKQVWKYITDNNLPYNPLHDHNYPSIGCRPCTEPVNDGDERDGRWKGTNKVECGLHTFTK
jgi:phosphoadenosine phosphosulfate reductase